jgi:hypothetical protein
MMTTIWIRHPEETQESSNLLFYHVGALRRT